MRWLLLPAVVGVASGCSLLLGEGLSGEGDPTSTPSDGGTALGADGAPVAAGDGGSPTPPGDGGCTTCTSPPVALDTLGTIEDVVADESGVYWLDTNVGDIVGADPDGSRKRTLCHTNAGPRRLALDGLNVFWTESGQSRVRSIAKTAIESDPVSFTLADARYIARGGTDLYVVQAGTTTSAMFRLGTNLASTTSTPIVDFAAQGIKPGQVPDLCADATSAFAAVSGNVNRVRSYPRTGGTGTDVTPKLGEVYGCAIDDARVYVASRADGVVRSNTKAGGGDVVYVSGAGEPVAVAVDAVNVYWSDATGKIFRASKAGGQAPELVADGQTAPGRIAVNSRAIYWVNDTKTVMMLRKP